MARAFVITLLLLANACNAKRTDLSAIGTLDVDATSVLESEDGDYAAEPPAGRLIRVPPAKFPLDWESKLLKARAVGQGAFGKVYVAHLKCDPDFPVAIKTMKLDDRNKTEMCRRENALVEALGSRSPRFTTAYKSHFGAGQGFIMMEAAMGGDFHKILNRGVDLGTKLRLWYEMLDGVFFMHKHRIVHKDLKPANVLLSVKCNVLGGEPCKAKVGDLGLACSMENPPLLPGVGLCRGSAGTPLYMPPESFAGQHSTRNDVWAMGVMLYEMLFNTLPYTIASPRSIQALQAAISRADFIQSDPNWRTIPLLGSPNLQPLLAGMMKVKVEERFTTAQVVEHAKALGLAADATLDENEAMPCWEPASVPVPPPVPVPEKQGEAKPVAPPRPLPKLPKARKPMKPQRLISMRASWPDDDPNAGEVDFFTIKKASVSNKPRFMCKPQLVDPMTGVVIATQHDLDKKTNPDSWPSALKPGDKIMTLNREPYVEFCKNMDIEKPRGKMSPYDDWVQRVQMRDDNLLVVEFRDRSA